MPANWTVAMLVMLIICTIILVLAALNIVSLG